LPRGQLVVPLPGGVTMLPVTGELAAALDQAAVCDERISSRWPLLRQPVAALARQLSAGRRALYIVAETFGGAGTQEAIGWQDGRLLYGPSGTCDIEADLEPGYHLVPRCDGAVNAGPARPRHPRRPRPGRVPGSRAGQAPAHRTVDRGAGASRQPGCIADRLADVEQH
jgi:hypothetical protein